MRRIAIVALLLSAVGLVVILRIPSEPEKLRVVAPGQPLPMDETVQMRFVDEKTGEEEFWTVTKRETFPGELHGRPLPKPDPRAGKHKPTQSARLLHDRGLEAWTRGEIREAMSLLEDAINTDPDDPNSRSQYGRLMLLALSYTEALPHLERAAELNPDEPQVWLDLATYYEKRRSSKRSREALRRAKELAGERNVSRDKRSGFWVIEGESIYP